MPFLTYVIRHLLSQEIRRYYFLATDSSAPLDDFLSKNFYYLDYQVITAGNIHDAFDHALEIADSRDILIAKGHCMQQVVIDDLSDHHIETQSDITAASGHFIMNTNGYWEDHNLNICIINRISYLKYRQEKERNLEKFFQSTFQHSGFNMVVQKEPIVDLSRIETATIAEKYLERPLLDLSAIGQGWTLFLDRDGVINYNKDESYVFHTGEFRFLPGAIEAIRKLNLLFSRTIVVTNQRGIGKGLMTIQALGEIHDHMISALEREGARIDALYYCTETDDKHFDRKPNPGMLLEARHMYPDIDFKRSLICGDKLSDMQLGRNVGAFTVLITSGKDVSFQQHPDVDACYDSLLSFAQQFSFR